MRTQVPPSGPETSLVDTAAVSTSRCIPRSAQIPLLCPDLCIKLSAAGHREAAAVIYASGGVAEPFFRAGSLHLYQEDCVMLVGLENLAVYVPLGSSLGINLATL